MYSCLLARFMETCGIWSASIEGLPRKCAFRNRNLFPPSLPASWAFELLNPQSQKVFFFMLISFMSEQKQHMGKNCNHITSTDLLKLTLAPLLVSLSLSPKLLKHREEPAEIAASWACYAFFLEQRVVPCSDCWLLCLRIFLSLLYSRSGLCVWLEIDIHVLTWHSKCCDFPPSPLWSAHFLCTGSQLLAYLISICVFHSPYTFLHMTLAMPS